MWLMFCIYLNIKDLCFDYHTGVYLYITFFNVYFDRSIILTMSKTCRNTYMYFMINYLHIVQNIMNTLSLITITSNHLVIDELYVQYFCK